ncbi:hypothetical protein FA15DRAFT_405221 [Coprinopsis marcescibilis]|uniref:BZIP domain-containing protein n=1 Tax=Coprinopsis marcescibilis TaxID=230819 RepID=A0A5C3K9L9_COPMA|nr:hypothetical protein FA15DRAFT_405221 [Coprinopsis marcescibilis]
MTAETIAELAKCAHFFNPHIEALLTNLPYTFAEFQRSERKRIASEKSAKVKARRISELEEENAGLREQIKELERFLH